MVCIVASCAIALLRGLGVPMVGGQHGVFVVHGSGIHTYKSRMPRIFLDVRVLFSFVVSRGGGCGSVMGQKLYLGTLVGANPCRHVAESCGWGWSRMG